MKTLTGDALLSIGAAGSSSLLGLALPSSPSPSKLAGPQPVRQSEHELVLEAGYDLLVKINQLNKNYVHNALQKIESLTDYDRLTEIRSVLTHDDEVIINHRLNIFKSLVRLIIPTKKSLTELTRGLTKAEVHFLFWKQVII